MRCLLFLLVLCCTDFRAGAQPSQNVRLLCHWNDTTGIRPAGDQYYNDVWGFTHDSVEYGVIGSTEGIHIIRVTDCHQAAFYPGRSRGSQIRHRDFRVYRHYLYAIADEGASTLQVFDLNTLPDSLHLVWESNPAQPLLAHTLWIDTTAARLYLNTARSLTFGIDHLQVYSLTNPELPVLTHRLNAANGLPDKVHTSFARNDTAWLSVSNYGFLVGAFDTANRFHLIGGTNRYPDQGYNHSSCVNEMGVGVMTDETHGLAMKVISTNNLPLIDIESLFSPCSGDTCVPHNVYLRGNAAFIAHYFQGLQVYDLSQPTQPIHTGWYDTYAPPAVAGGFAGAWGVFPYLPSGKVLVSDMKTGLYVLDASAAMGVDAVAEKPLDITLSPNPATDFIRVDFPLLTAPSLLRVVDLVSGKTLMTQTLAPGADQIRLPLPAHWPPALYGLQLQSNNERRMLRFYKKD